MHFSQVPQAPAQDDGRNQDEEVRICECTYNLVVLNLCVWMILHYEPEQLCIVPSKLLESGRLDFFLWGKLAKCSAFSY